mmetsp:Transcript_122732/g.382099  ORF Transcript_122732/g.382099 Transcript_122732/m.382099 type:complete len:275 (-) Transcript_122732:208-1032(-)
MSASHDMALVNRDHVLDVDESILTSVRLEHFQSLLDEVTEVLALSLGVVHLVTEVLVLRLEYVENWEDLPVVGHQCLANHLATEHESLQDFQHRCHDLRISCVQRCLDRYNELRHHGQDLCTALLQHVVGPLHRKEAVRVLLLAEAVKENGQVVVVVELFNVHLPDDLAAYRAVEDLDGHVAAIVEAAKLGPGDGPPNHGACPRRRARGQGGEGPAILRDAEGDVLVDPMKPGAADRRCRRALRHPQSSPGGSRLPQAVRNEVGRVVAEGRVGS